MKILSLLLSISLFVCLGAAEVRPIYCPEDCEEDLCNGIWCDGGPDCVITPGAGPCVECGFNSHLSISFLYWTARQERLGFAYPIDLQLGSWTSQSDLVSPDFSYSPGFKVAVGYIYDHDGWDIEGRYTYLRPCADPEQVTITDPMNQAIGVLWPFTVDPTELTPDSIEGQWKLDFNVVDLELGRNFFISQCLALRPHFGLKGTWQDQVFQTKAKGQGHLSLFETIDHHKVDSWGIGIRSGLDTSWSLGCFGLYANVALAALWEKFDIEERSVQEGIVQSPMSLDIVLINIKNRVRAIKPIVELVLGVRWESWFCCERYYIRFDAGWEIQWWEGQNQFFENHIESRGGDLSLHGLTANLRFDF